MDTPIDKFKKLSLDKRLDVIDKLFTFFDATIKAGYIAVDFYDSSIIYDFDNYSVSFCDIDLFKKMPATNDLGENYYGTKRLKAPEENKLGAIIDEQTNIFTLGAVIFDLLSDVKNNEERYKIGHFIPNSLENFALNEKQYKILMKATSLDRNERYKNIEEFYCNWNNSIPSK